jgi:ubiquinone/menaquinone biosynthesis C-methylase UbiE
MTEQGPRPFRPPWPIDQFVRPRGMLGRVAGEAMAIFNARLESRAIGLLELTGAERALEIGFGPGVGIGMLVERLPLGSVAGIDPSQTMLDMASGRNRRALDDGKLDLRLGTVSELPWPDQSFDAACTVNNINLWRSLRPDLAEVQRVLAPGGRLAIALHAMIVPRSRPPFDEYLATSLADVGFSSVDVRREWVLPAPALIAIARK